ncbi:MBL fold metallo-hydrolase [Acinetobacter sp. B5B]|uniref:MBL fold metallo-hydrolase n=1 Tax=Acinetobacter baretiae TaxID=2605383 RepID=UPI0018C34D2B|nr:MBL fold metallo-hydrolase [Acinetobacter baretiae]MBF7684196.1 MBL fold metallo-hydrolase [Acinetobacter baretiae]
MSRKISIFFILFNLFLASHTFAESIKLKTYLASPIHFGITSTLIETDKEIILVNAQFTKSEALRVAAEILDTGKKLTTIFVSYGDPDYYFSLDILKNIFPDAKIIATLATVKHIKNTYQAKKRYWLPTMGINAPSEIIIPDEYTLNTFKISEEEIQIKGEGELTYLWIPQIKAIVGGIQVTSGVHIWMTDFNTLESRQNLLNSLTDMKKMNPEIVIPAHTISGAEQNIDAVNFSIKYLEDYNIAVKRSKNSQELIQIIENQYPDLKDKESLKLEAKVVKDGFEWK